MKMSQPIPELAVPSVRKAQEYYRDRLGFEIAWYNEQGRIGAVALGDCAIFFREASQTHDPSVFWVFSEDVDATHAELNRLGADILGPPVDEPWGLRQFTIRDAYGNLFHFHHDTEK